MVQALGFNSENNFVVQLSDGRTIAIPEGDLHGLASVCRNADLFVKPRQEERSPYFQSVCFND